MTEMHADIMPTTRPFWRKPVWWIVAALLAALLAWRFLAGGPDADKRHGMGRGGTPPVAVAVATRGDVRILLDGLGTVTPVNTVTVHSRVDGHLMRILFQEGQSVKAGDLLAEIDPRPFQAQLAQAEGQLAQARAQLENARLDLKRYTQLAAQDAIPVQQADTQKALVAQYEGAVKSAEGAVADARLQVEYSRITAPISGRVGLRQVDPGNVIHASDVNGLVVMTQTQPATVVFAVPQDNVPVLMRRMAAGAKLPVEAWDSGGTQRLASGQLIAVDSVIDSATGTVKLKAKFDNADNALFANQFVNARLLLDTRKNAVTAPVAAIQRGAAGSFVYVLGGDLTVKTRAVKPGPVDGDRAAVDQGLEPGEKVVVDGIDKLRDGLKVTLARPAGKADDGGKRRKGGKDRQAGQS